MGKIRSISKLLPLIFYLMFSLFYVCAYDESVSHITRNDLSQFNFNVGPSVHVEIFESDKHIDFGMYYSLIFTPARFEDKFSLGIKFNIDVAGFTRIFNGFSEVQTHYEITLDYRYLLKKSFEIYGAFGACILIFDYNGIKNFSQKFGLVLQGGARGRLNDTIGLGLEGSISLVNPRFENKKISIDKSLSSLVIRAYFSVEI